MNGTASLTLLLEITWILTSKILNGEFTNTSLTDCNPGDIQNHFWVEMNYCLTHWSSQFAKCEYLVWLKLESRIVCTIIMVKLIANGWAWRWCLPKWVAITGRATSLEPQAMSRVHRLPRQLCERPPPTRHRHTDQVSGDTCQPYTYWIHQWGREGKGEKAEQQNACCFETNSTSHSRNDQHAQFEKTCMSPPCAWFPDHRWPALAWF